MEGKTMTQDPGDIITVPHAEIDDIDPLTAAFGALAEEDGDPDRMVGRRLMIVDMVSSIRLFDVRDVAMDAPILILQVPVGGMTMGLIEDLCDVAIEHHARSLGETHHAPHDAWHFRRDGDAVCIRPCGGGTIQG
jgi:hypothetical protein